MMREGQRSYIPGIGRIRIDRVEQVRLEELADEDAIPDGFANADALRAEINAIYGDKIAAGHQAYRVVFHVLEELATHPSEPKSN